MIGTYLIEASSMISRDAPAAREELLRSVGAFAREAPFHVIVVFDGDPDASVPEVRGVRVRYPRRRGNPASARVLGLARKRAREGETVVVVTGDDDLMEKAKHAGASVLTARAMKRVLQYLAK
jgi:glycosyltransferase involved in cell wall biosynthesis